MKTTPSITQAKYSSIRSIVPPNDRITTTARISARRDPGVGRLLRGARHAPDPGPEQRRGRAARERGPAELEEAEQRVEAGPDARPRREAHDPGQDRLARVERVADRLEVEDHLEHDRDRRDQEDLRRVLHRGGRAHQPLAAADRGRGHDRAGADHLERVPEREGRGRRELRHVPRRQVTVAAWERLVGSRGRVRLGRGGHGRGARPAAGAATNGDTCRCRSREGLRGTIRPHDLMKITAVRATPVSVPLVAPLRHANGCHWGRFVRTIVEVETDDGLVGLGEMGGGGESAPRPFKALEAYLLGHDPARLEEMRFRIANPTASLYNNRTQLLAALEFACLDLIGQKWGVPVSEILGGRLRDRVPFASYLFFRYPNPRDGTGRGAQRRPARGARPARSRVSHGFTSHKLKGGVFPPEYELECYRALAAALPGDRFRFDPNGVWSTEQAIWFGQAIEDLKNDYLEDPVYGLQRHAARAREGAHAARDQHRRGGLRAARGERARHRRRRDPARHDVLGRDPALRQGGRDLRDVPARRRGALLGRARHPARDDAAHGRRDPEPELRRRRALPPPAGRRDRGRPRCRTREAPSRCPPGRGSACASTARSSARYHEEFKRLGSYPYDQDPLRPGWAPLLPNDRFADPTDGRVPKVPV